MAGVFRFVTVESEVLIILISKNKKIPINDKGSNFSFESPNFVLGKIKHHVLINLKNI